MRRPIRLVYNPARCALCRLLAFASAWLLILLFAAPIAAQIKITRVEYFVDIDPGQGNATPLSFSPAAQLANLQLSINTGSLSSGVHQLGIRSHDSLGRWSLTTRHLFFKPFISAASQPASKITYAEWYLDTDPGRGNASAISLSPANDINGMVVGFDPSLLGSGMHQFNLRVKDSLGNWSLAQRLMFIRPFTTSTVAPTPSKVVYGEWYIDADPGRGAATPITITPGTDINGVVVSVNHAALTEGMHQFNARFRDSLGNWSLGQRLMFIKPFATSTNVPLPSKIVYGEWYLDADPGRGAATPIGITPGTDISGTVISINPSTLTDGMHQFNVRVRDSAGNWSLAQRLMFIKPYSSITAAIAPSKVIYGEWYLDIDPGRGAATPVSITPGTDISAAIVSINPASLTEGVHQFNARFRDSLGNWSLAQRLLFYKPYQTASAAAIPNLAYIEYYIDTDPGSGNGAAISFSPGNNINNLLVSVNKTGLSLGAHKLFLRARDSVGKWSLVNTANFTLISPNITVDTFPSVICAGTNVTIPFTLNGSFNIGNVFTVQLSNAAGSFTSPVNIASKTANTSDTINALIPANAVAGTQYRIRIISSLPADTSGPNSFPITVRRLPEQAFSIIGPAYTCTDTQFYNYSPVQSGVTYTWKLLTSSFPASSIQVLWDSIGPGEFPLIVTSSNSCGVGFSDTIFVRVFGDTPILTPVITKIGNTLSTSRQLVSNGVLSYQWYRDSVLIAGATDTFYNATVNGQYSVRYTNSCGTGPWSVPVTIGNLLAQTINFPLIPGKAFGDSAFVLSATASSSLPVSFAILGGPAQLKGDTLTITGAGTVTVRASQAGNSQYTAATPVTRTFVVVKAPQTITLFTSGDKVYGDAPFPVSATASTGLPVSFSVVSGRASVSGNTVSLTGGGSVVLMAYQPGNQNYLSAFVHDTFCVGARQPDTIRGFTSTCISTQRYYVDSIAGHSYAWSVSGGGGLSPASGGATNVAWNTNGNYTLTVAATTGCNSTAQSASLPVQVISQPQPGAPSNLYPLDSVVLSTFPFPFSWAPSSNALQYDLYIWPDGSPMPSNPVGANLYQIGFAVGVTHLQGFAPGKRYLWKVVAKNACSQTGSVTRTFTTVNIPDLMVNNINAPDTVFSGQTIDVDVIVKNIAQANTSSVWMDQLFLSADTVYNVAVDPHLGTRYNTTGLGLNQSYTNPFRVSLPVDAVGAHYVLARANANGYQSESSTSNNTGFRPLYIKLTPPPDLKVTSVVTPGAVFSGQGINVNWTVKNQGTGNTTISVWLDNLYISADSVFDPGNAILLGSLTYSKGILKADSSYSQSKLVTIPGQVFGKHYIHVVTDAANKVYEYAFENNNNGRNDSLIVYLTPPPDYTIANFNAPTTVSRGEVVTVDWTVKNLAAVRLLKDSFWADAIYISTDSVFSLSKASRLAVVAPPQVRHPLCSLYNLGVNGCRWTAPLMQFNETYYSSAQVNMQGVNADSAYLYVFTDYSNQIYEYNKENNNTARIKLKFRHPDLSVPTIQAPSTALAGTTVNTSWTVKNAGPGKLLSARTDRLSLSPNAVYSPSGLTTLDYTTYYQSMDSGDIITVQRTVKIPETISGTQYFFVETDYPNVIYEGGQESNNRSVSAAIQVSPPLLPDLQVTSMIMASGNVVSETNVGFVYTVKNIGSGTLQGKSWTDQIYLSKLSVWNPDSARLLKTISRTHTLQPDSVYQVSDSVYISMNTLRDMKINMVNCYFYVKTDGGDAVYEGGAEANNIGRSSATYVMHAEHADLAVINVVAPTALQAGGAGQIAWTVQNLGGKTGYYYGYWYDGLYLSLDTIWNVQDSFVTDAAISGIIEKDSSYIRTLNFTVPHGISGNYHLLIVADHKNYNRDKDTSNNYKTRVVRDLNGNVIPTTITMPTPSDLRVDSFQLPNIGYSGQPLTAKWQVRNHAAGVTNKNTWTERVYLSTDTIVSAADQILGSYSRTGSLSGGASYRDSMKVFLPATAQGNYYVLFVTDNNNVVYEHLAEHNNVAKVVLFVIKPDPSDLIVSGITVDTSIIVGDSATVSWTIANIGQNPAVGYFKEGLYFSKDSVWSNDDVLLISPEFNTLLASAASASHSQKFRVKGLTPGSYYAIVRTDLLNNLVESNEANNTGSSPAVVKISVRQLPINVLTPAMLSKGDELYYRIEVPDSLQGETLIVTLKGDSARGANELYIRYDTVATRIKYDYAFSKAISANQDIIIPALKKGSYYVLVYGTTTAANGQQPISLLARKIDFSILSVAAKEGGNTGVVTVKIEGAKFEPGMKARLHKAALGTITANSVYFSSSTTVYATFNLAGAQTGMYDVRLVKPGLDSVTLANGFTISKGAGSVTGGGSGGGNNGFFCSVVNTGVNELLGIEVQHPTSTRTRRVFPMTIIYGNSGNVDIPVPTRMLVSVGTDPISLVPEGMEDRKTEIFLEFREPNGPPHILRPGATGSITIFTQSLTGRNLEFKLVE